MSADARSDAQASDVIVVGAGVAAVIGRLVRWWMRDTPSPFSSANLLWGGRAFSYEHPALQEVVDSQHVLLGCCTNLMHLLQRTGASELIRWYETVNFLEPGGRLSEITPSGLPAPLHSSFSFLKAQMLNTRDKIGIARGMMDFLKGIPADDTESVAQWMKRSGQTRAGDPAFLGAGADHHAERQFRELLASLCGEGVPRIIFEDYGRQPTRHSDGPRSATCMRRLRPISHRAVVWFVSASLSTAYPRVLIADGM